MGTGAAVVGAYVISTKLNLKLETVDTNNIVDLSVTTEKIADGAVTAGKIADGTIVTAEIANQTVTTAKIADAAITPAQVKTKTVVALADAAATLTAAQMIDSGIFTITPTVARILTTDTAANIVAALPRYQVGTWFDFTVVNPALFDVTLAAGTGITLSGKRVVRDGSATWKARIDSATAVTIYNTAVSGATPWALVRETVGAGETCVIPSSYSLLGTNNFASSGTIVNNGRLVLGTAQAGAKVTFASVKSVKSIAPIAKQLSAYQYGGF